MTEKVREFYSERSENFAERHSLENAPESYLEVLRDFTEKIGSGKILDAGCGPGRDVRYFKEKGFTAIGIDASKEMIKEAEKKGNADYKVMDVRNLEFEEEKFDGIWCNTVLIFFEKDVMENILDQFEEILKPGVYIHLGLKEGEGTFERESKNSSIKQHLLKKDEAVEMIKSVNFEVEEVYTTKTDEKFNFPNIIGRKLKNSKV